MKKLILALTLAVPAAHAQTFNWQAIQQQLMAHPGVQQQAAQTVAANPQLLTGAANAFANMTPEQQQQLAAQITAISNKLFTKNEQAKLTEFQKTPEGASIISKMPAFAEQLAPVLLQMYLSQSAGLAPSAN